MRGEYRPITVLIVEDNEDHVILINKALRDNGIVNDIRVAVTGEEALDYLFRRDRYAGPATSPRPGLILLDLKLPGISGIEVLKAIKEDADLKLIPVVMLTTSTSDNEVMASYNCGANSYIQKPVDFGQFVSTVRNLRMYWLLLNTPPPATAAG